MPSEAHLDQLGMLWIVFNDQNAKWLRHEKSSLGLIENSEMAYFYLSARKALHRSSSKAVPITIVLSAIRLIGEER